MKIMATMRYLPIVLASAILAVSCTGVQDVANVTPDPTTNSQTVKGNYSFSEILDSIQTVAPEGETPAQFFYLKREYNLELVGTGQSGNDEARLFIMEWASPDRVFIFQYQGTFRVSEDNIQLTLTNKTLCDGINIPVNGKIQSHSANRLQLSLQHCPPASKNIVLIAEPVLTKNLSANTTTHN